MWSLIKLPHQVDRLGEDFLLKVSIGANAITNNFLNVSVQSAQDFKVPHHRKTSVRVCEKAITKDEEYNQYVSCIYIRTYERL